jgi:hypothetical protein
MSSERPGINRKPLISARRRQVEERAAIPGTGSSPSTKTNTPNEPNWPFVFNNPAKKRTQFANPEACSPPLSRGFGPGSVGGSGKFRRPGSGAVWNSDRLGTRGGIARNGNGARGTGNIGPARAQSSAGNSEMRQTNPICPLFSTSLGKNEPNFTPGARRREDG